MKKLSICIVALVTLLFNACQSSPKQNYATDLALLQKYTPVIELTNNSGKSRILLTPNFQGRVMTSSASGLDGATNGWINRPQLVKDTIHTGGPYGGEDRVWIGPLGGQHSFYYQQIKPLHDDNWNVPKAFNDEPFQITQQTNNKVSFQKRFQLTNYIGTKFDLLLHREVTLLNHTQIEKQLSITLPKKLNYVAYQSANKLINKGDSTWSTTTGLASLWSMGMFQGTDQSKVLLPIQKETDFKQLATYFAPLNNSRLQLKGKTIVYKADGKLRNKIALPPNIATPIFGSYEPERGLLHIIQYKTTSDTLFFNSKVEEQVNPYQGEVIPVYNNGPMTQKEAPENSFYELESLSPMLPLSPNDTLTHYHRVYHFQGNVNELNTIAEQLLGVNLLTL